MFYKQTKKDALLIHENAVKKYNTEYQTTEKQGEALYQQRKEAQTLLGNIENLINSIANTPKDFSVSISRIQAEREMFCATEKYAEEALKSEIKSGVGIAAGVATGAAVASMAPTAAMWVATTFGTASTGTAISSLSGAAATKAALAWLGGGALKAGGLGIAGGKAILALAGPIGWGVAGVSVVSAAAFVGHNNKKVADSAIEEAKQITLMGAILRDTNAQISHLLSETILLASSLEKQLKENVEMQDADYTKLSVEAQLRLGTMVNNTLSLAALLNKTV